ncbi:hypothetical protein ACH5RR_023725 [Cinchona calisaya]|uniref:Uncharacterized protein n=1 Tax=Cinchona calisaya TaxID=153742 RepID=A0ABD2ZBJ1_9GENT
MAMQLGRNLGKYLTATSPAGFGGSSIVRRGGSGTAIALQPARQFSSWSTTTLKREFSELLAEAKELSFKDYLQLTVGTTICAYAVLSYSQKAVNGLTKMFSSLTDGSGSGRDGCSSAKGV